MKIYKKKSIRKGQNSVKCYQILGKTVLRKEKNDAIKKYAFFGEKWGIFKQKKSELIEGKSVKQAAEPVPQAHSGRPIQKMGQASGYYLRSGCGDDEGGNFQI